MNTESWIPLTDYSSKHRVSVSTLRRRIKAEDIKYRFQDGKYYLLDTPMGAHPREHRPSLKSDASSMGTQMEVSLAASAKPSAGQIASQTVSPIASPTAISIAETPKKMPPSFASQQVNSIPSTTDFRPPDFKKEMTEAFITKGHAVFNAHLQNAPDEPILTAANKLLNELKKAYTLVLQEKEEQLLQLKQEVTDLKTLVRVLENENARLQPHRRPSY
jgi:hypothetical protein